MDAVGSFLMDQLLKMQWLSDLIAIFIDALGLDASSRWGGTLHFFIYDTIKIVILLCVMIFIISYIQSYFPPERSKRILGRFKGFSGNVVGALLGTVNALLRLFVHSVVHCFYACGFASWRYFFFSHILSHGRHCLNRSHHEYLWTARCFYLYDRWSYHCGCGRFDHSEIEDVGSGR